MSWLLADAPADSTTQNFLDRGVLGHHPVDRETSWISLMNFVDLTWFRHQSLSINGAIDDPTPIQNLCRCTHGTNSKREQRMLTNEDGEKTQPKCCCSTPDPWNHPRSFTSNVPETPKGNSSDKRYRTSEPKHRCVPICVYIYIYVYIYICILCIYICTIYWIHLSVNAGSTSTCKHLCTYTMYIYIYIYTHTLDYSRFAYIL